MPAWETYHKDSLFARSANIYRGADFFRGALLREGLLHEIHPGAALTRVIVLGQYIEIQFHATRLNVLHMRGGVCPTLCGILGFQLPC